MRRPEMMAAVVGVALFALFGWSLLHPHFMQPESSEPPGTPGWQLPPDPNGNASTASVVTIQDMRLHIDGEPAPLIQCVGYQPVPPGVSVAWGYRWASEPENYESDLPMLQAMGANTVAVHIASAEEPSQLQRFMTRAFEHGLRTILIIDGPYRDDVPDPGAPEVEAQLLERVEQTASHLKDHPGLLAWQIGVEVDYVYRNTEHVAAWYKVFENATRHMQAIDPHHPVFTASSTVTDIHAFLTESPSADLYGINTYSVTRGEMAGYLNNLSRHLPQHPVLVTEFGADAYDHRIGAENETLQADVVMDVWNGIVEAHASGAAILGACVHEWSDQWWKGGEPDAQQAEPSWEPYRAENLPDGRFSEQWFGIVRLDPDGGKEPRLLYYRLAEAWGSRR